MQLLPWIMKNMIGESPKKTVPEIRQPSEAELRVQRSLKRLDVPDWYTNKVRPSPKIIKDRRPIECRPAPWKDTTKKQSRIKKSLESAVKLAANYEAHLLEFVELPIGPSSNISKTFPKMSPSRKIQNINIVFPPSEKSARSPGESARSVRAEKSAGISESNGSSGSKKLAESKESATVSQSNRTTTLTTPKKSADSTRSEKIRQQVFLETDFPVGSTESIVSMSAFTPQKMSSLKNQTKSVTSSTPLRAEIDEPRPGSTVPSVSYSCREKLFGTPQKSGDSQQEIDTESGDHSETLTSMTEQLFASPNKSMAMERIIKFEKRKNMKLPKKGLVEEIIQELTSKCKSKVKTTRTSPVSKTFVQRLVRALESDRSSEIDTDLDGKSVTASSSDNVAELSESSRCSPFENFRKELEDRRIAGQKSAEAHFDEHDVFWIPLRIPKMPRTSSVKSMASGISSPGLEIDDETEKRPPISEEILPISEKSASTRSVNPIEDTAADRTWELTGAKADLDWGKTYYKENPKLLRIEEAGVIDSGYSDRSGTISQTSSLETDDNYWYRDIETKGWVSEIGDDFVDSCLREVEYNCGIPMRKQRVTAV